MEHLEQLRYSGLFEARVPRYTSYPPVSRFVRTEGKLYHRRWLNAIPHGAELSIYLHVPYCKTVCNFCVYRTQATENAGIVDAYLDVIEQEIALVASELPQQVRLARLYLGGGTPTLMSPGRLTALLDRIYSAFPRSENFECLVEIDCTQIEEPLIEVLIAQGMSRAIVGVQDFDPRVQKVTGRQQSFEQTLNTVQSLRAAGLKKLDMELLYGLPAQSAASIAETTQQVLALDPDRLAVCEYAHMPNLAKRQILVDARCLPEAEDAFLMSQVARQILRSDGYAVVGIDHFARPGDNLIKARDEGRLRRDFQGYSDNATHAMIGLGASAISRFPQGYVQNSSATSIYCDTVRNGRLSGNRGYKLTSTDLVIACMIEMLMCRFCIDITDVSERFPGSTGIVDRAVSNIGTVFDPYVEITPEMLRVKPEAHPLARMISSSLDRIGNAESEL